MKIILKLSLTYRSPVKKELTQKLISHHGEDEIENNNKTTEEEDDDEDVDHD
jgi:hypothetical protein